jgi:phosphatidylglycerophosphate synthase
VSAVERLMLELVRGNPKRLMVLLAATVLSYVCMALEAWIILRASGAAVTLNGAFAVETFSRVASFASAFIPANLGALEASSLAAAAAIGVQGGAALAIARRIRGLFWAGLGLALYPRKARPAHPDEARTPARPPTTPGSTLLYIPHEPDVLPPATARLAGLPILERVITSASRAGYDRIIAWIGDVPPEVAAGMRRVAASEPAAVLVATDAEWSSAMASMGESGAVTVVGPGTVTSPALLSLARAIEPTAGTPCDVPAGPDWRESGVLRMTAPDAADRGAVGAALGSRRTSAGPLPSGEDVSSGRARLALRVTAPGDLAEAEAAIRRASYKDTDNTLARFNRRISLPISVALIRTPLTANQLSILLVAIGFYAAWLFSIGHYWTGVLGAFLSLAASVLDGCDGEIARLKYQESALGCWIETFGDYSYYIAIFAGLTIGAVRQTHAGVFYWIGAAAMAGTLLSFAFLIFLRSRITAGRPERLHAVAKERFNQEPTRWSRLVWRLSFTATRSAMPYGIFAFALVGFLPAIVVLAAIGANVYWISLMIKLRDLMRDEDALVA